MNVLDVTEFFSERGGGVRSHLAAKGHILCQLGHHHAIVAPGHGIPAEWPKSSRLLRVGGPAMPYDPSYHLLWRPDRVAQLVDRERPDVLEIHSPYVAAMGALAAKRSWFGTRTFFWHSDFIDTYEQVLLHQASVPLLARRAITQPLWAWVRQIGNRCDATISASRSQVEKLRAHGVPRVEHLPFGIDKQTFRSRDRNDSIRRGFGVQDDEALIVGVGRFAIEKRWDVVIESFIEVRKQRPARLVLFGDGPEKSRLLALANSREDILFAGFSKDREELASTLASADVLVHGCPHETFGLSIAEAIGCGLPVVVPDRGGAFEQVNETFAEVYQSENPRACAEAVLRILSRDRAALRNAALVAAKNIFSIEEHFERLVALYTDLIAKNTAWRM